MQTNPDQSASPIPSDERLMDALLHEHARAGTGADDDFLARLESALDEKLIPLPQPSASPPRRSSHRLAWSLGLAATIVVIVAGLSKPQIIRMRKQSAAASEARRDMVPLRTDYPPELIEGTPKAIILPGQTPSPAARREAPVVTQPPAPITPPPAVVPNPRPAPKPAAEESREVPPNFQSGTAQPPPVDRERYGQLVDNPWQTPVDAPLSTFSIDVDTASYSNLRRLIQSGSRIPPDAVRLEELVNYFDYTYPQPTGEHPFAVRVDNATCPWNPDHQLVRVAMKGRDLQRTERPAANLVFLLDVSGSMNEPRKLPLVIQSFQLLIEELNASDTLTIVVYAGAEGLALPPTACDAEGRKRIITALSHLQAGGTTNGGAGIQLAYRLAKEQFKPGGINRVILATDGDFNVGVTEDGGLVSMVEQNAKSNVFLSVLGFGTGNLNDGMLEAITNKGNGTHYYIDTLQEARRVFLQKLMGTLVTIAKDVKIQIEFNPGQIKQYRLLGYANRMLRKEDFSNDKIDAGDLGAGHTVTAFYEVETGDASQTPPAEKLRYGTPKPAEPAEPADPADPAEPAPAAPTVSASSEWLTVKLRYKQPEGDRSTFLETPFTGTPHALAEADSDFRFGAAVAMTGLLLRGTEGTAASSFGDVRSLAAAAIGGDPHGLRAEFVRLAEQLATRPASGTQERCPPP